MLQYHRLFTLIPLLAAMQLSVLAHAQEEDIPVPDAPYEQGQLEPPIEPLDAMPADPDPTPAQQLAPAADAPETDARPSKVFSRGGVALVGGIGGGSFLELGFNAGRALFSIGFSVRYEPAGLSNGTEHSLDTLSLALSGSVAIMAYNRTRLAFGPELAFTTNITPGPAITSATVLLPGLALWYKPFEAPLLIGTALQLALRFARGSDPVVETAYPGLRLRWGF